MAFPLTDRSTPNRDIPRCRMSLRGIAIIVALLEFLGGRVQSQVLPFHSYTVRDGLISNNINTIYQDSRGYMWFGTTEGISVFDGRTFTNYSTLNGLPHNFVTRIFEDRTTPGRMWVLAGDNVCRLIDGEISVYPLPDSLVGSLYQDHEGVVWCGTNHGLIRIKDDKPTFFRPKLLEGHVGLIAEVGDSLMWFASEGHGLVSYASASETFSQVDINHYGEGTLWSMFGDHEGNLWVGMKDHYVLRIHGKDMVTPRILAGSTSWLTENGKGTLWLGGYDGIGSIAKDQFLTGHTVGYTTANGLPENTIRSLFVDREQNLWVGGRDEGVAKLSTVRTLRFEIGVPSEYGLAHGLPYAASDDSGHIWALTDRGLQEFWRDLYGRWEHFIHIPGTGNQLASTPWILHISHSRLWIGHAYMKVTPYQYKIESFALRTDPAGGHSHLVPEHLATPELPSSSGLAFIVGNDGTVWQSLGMKGIARWNPSQKSSGMRYYGEDDSVPTNYIRTLIQDHAGNIWGGSLKDGLVRFSPDDIHGRSAKRFTPANGLPDWGVWSIMEDRSREILVGTSRGGLAVIHGDSVRTISSKDGIPSNTIYCMTEDAIGRLWLGTQIGMVNEDPPGSKRFLKNQAFVGEGVHCCGTTKDGLLWFATPSDLCIYDYIHVDNDTISPPAYITTIRVNGSLQPQQPDLQLPHERNNCEFDFIGISFRDERTIRYQYRMLGVDKAWQGPTSQNSVTYASLVPGAYRFEVKAFNVDGIESSVPASFSFAIIPPYWQRWWFYLSAFLTAGAAIVMIFRYRVRKLVELERMRVRIASDLHDDVGSTLTKISLQADLLQKEMKGEDAQHMVKRIGAMSRDVVNTMSDLVWSIDARNDTVGDLVDRMRDVASGVLSHQEMSMAFDVKGLDDKKRLPVDVRQNLYLIFKEAITNSAKYANTSRVNVSLENTTDHFVMKIADEGTNALRQVKLTGHGLKNMEMRAKRIGGKFETTRENGFTIIVTTKPL